jgi:sugar (glycoside-pentoside-hexuronide) transporter
MAAGTALSRKERNSYVFAGFGQNLVITFVSTFLLVYLYEGVGFSARGVALITSILAAIKVWDAITDLIMGVFVDRTRTRWGKLRPYILASAPPVAAFSILLFWSPPLSEAWRIAYVAIVYLLWEAAYTACDVPYWGLTGAITSDEGERGKLISYARTLGTIALGVTTLAGPQLAILLGGGTRATAAGWTRAAALVSVLGMGLFTLAFFNTREKVAPPAERRSLKEMVSLIAKNRPLLLVLLGSALGFGRNVVQVGGAVVALVVFGSEGRFTILGASIIAAIILSTLVTPLVLARVSKKRLMIWSSVLSAGAYLLMFAAGWSSFPLVVALIFAAGFFTGFFIVTQTAMIADSVDYMEYQSGDRNEGVCFAGLTFVSKLMGALATFSFGLAVAAVGYAKGVPIDSRVKDGVYLAMTLVPAASCLAGTVPFFFYPLTEERMKEILAAVMARREAAARGAGRA